MLCLFIPDEIMLEQFCLSADILFLLLEIVTCTVS